MLKDVVCITMLDIFAFIAVFHGVGSGGRAVERRTVNRGDGGSIPFRNLGNFFHLTLPVSFGRATKSRWSLLFGVYARGSKKSHTGGKCVACNGLTNSTEGQLMR